MLAIVTVPPEEEAPEPVTVTFEVYQLFAPFGDVGFAAAETETVAAATARDPTALTLPAASVALNCTVAASLPTLTGAVYAVQAPEPMRYSVDTRPLPPVSLEVMVTERPEMLLPTVGSAVSRLMVSVPSAEDWRPSSDAR